MKVTSLAENESTHFKEQNYIETNFLKNMDNVIKMIPRFKSYKIMLTGGWKYWFENNHLSDKWADQAQWLYMN